MMSRVYLVDAYNQGLFQTKKHSIMMRSTAEGYTVTKRLSVKKKDRQHDVKRVHIDPTLN